MGDGSEGGGFLWAIGGKIEDAYAVGDTTVYSIAEDRWHSSVNGELTPMPHAVQGAGWTLHEGKIYCFGGKTDAHTGCCAHVQVYDIARDEWTLADPMPAPRSKLGKFYPVVDDRYVYLFGGDSEKGRFDRVAWNWRYDLATCEWETDLADAPFSQSFPGPSYHDGWLYYATGNTQCTGPHNTYPGALNQRCNPQTDEWQVVAPCPHPVTDGCGDVWQGEYHFLGGWNTNPAFYHEGLDHYVGPVRRLHCIYSYEANAWRYGELLPGHWHHGGARSSGRYLWRYLGTIDEGAGEGVDQHTNRIFRWDGEEWAELSPAPVRKMNFGNVYSRIGPGSGA
jgi:hypothetical protein